MKNRCRPRLAGESIAEPSPSHRLRGFGFHVKSEFPRVAIRHQVGVLRCFFPPIGRLCDGLQATQPFHVHIAFEARQQQSQRITLLRA